MVIRVRNEYLKLKEQLMPILKDNPAYKSGFEVFVEDMLNQGVPVDVEITNGRKITATKEPLVKDFLGSKESVVKIYEASLMEDDSLEIIMSDGSLFDAGQYNNCHMEKVPSDSKSVLSTFYLRQEFDRDGIEVVRTSYSKAGYPLKTVKYDDTDSLNSLLQSVKHRPKYDGSGVILPEISNCAVVESIGRVADNPAFAMWQRYQRGKSDNPQDKTKAVISLGVVDQQWPEMLRVNHYSLFADRVDGEWKIRKDAVAGCSTIEEATKALSLLWEQNLERSLTKKQNLPEYAVLKERMVKANKEYVDEKAPKQKKL